MPASSALAARVARFHDFVKRGDRSRALDEVALVQQESPDEKGVVFFLTGLFFLEEGYPGRALQAMEQAVRAEPSSRECLYGLAMANSALGFYQEVLFCNKIGASTKEIARERGWGDLLTPALRAKDRFLFATDEQIVLAIVDQHRRSNDLSKAVSVAEDALLVFPQNHDWRRAAIVSNRALRRPFAAAALLQPFAAQEKLNLEDQLLTGKIFADLGRIEESSLWYQRVAQADSGHVGCRVAVAKLLFGTRPPRSQTLLSLGKSFIDGLPPLPRRRGKKTIVKNRIRIGIVSADLFLGGLVERVALLFEMFDKSNIEFFLYIDAPQHDALTERFMALSKDHYHTHAVDDVTFARIVQEDEIDILLDLDLRCVYRRPAVARLKPASLHVVAFADPHEAHRWGYDAVLSDPYLSPKQSRSTGDQTSAQTSTENFKVLDDTTPCPVLRPRLGFLQVADLFDVQPVVALPHDKVRVGLSAAYAAFDEVARALLVRCLREVPHFELIVDSETLGGEQAAATLLAALEEALPPEEHSRLRFLPEQTSLTSFLQQTDLLLDIACPRSAYTLWQCLRNNISVLTLAGTNVAERLGLSVASQLELQDMCVCLDDDDLLSRLRAFCSDPRQQHRARQELQRCAVRRRDPQPVLQKALAVVEALFEGFVVLGREGRYQAPNGSAQS